MQNPKHSFLHFISFITCIAPSLLWASNAINPKLPFQIQSDMASFEQINHQAMHEGNVILTQGSHTLHADKLSITKDVHGKHTVIKATGDPATFSGKIEGKTGTEPNDMYATAKTIYFYPEKQLIVLEGKATLEHQRDKFQGPTLSYQLDKQVIFAKKHSNERPTVIIHPRA